MNEAMFAFLNRTYPGVWRNATFEREDESGYWFSFELVTDDRRQTWCVRHGEVSV